MGTAAVGAWCWDKTHVSAPLLSLSIPVALSLPLSSPPHFPSLSLLFLVLSTSLSLPLSPSLCVSLCLPPHSLCLSLSLCGVLYMCVTSAASNWTDTGCGFLYSEPGQLCPSCQLPKWNGIPRPGLSKIGRAGVCLNKLSGCVSIQSLKNTDPFCSLAVSLLEKKKNWLYIFFFTLKFKHK